MAISCSGTHGDRKCEDLLLPARAHLACHRYHCGFRPPRFLLHHCDLQAREESGRERLDQSSLGFRRKAHEVNFSTFGDALKRTAGYYKMHFMRVPLMAESSAVLARSAHTVPSANRGKSYTVISWSTKVVDPDIQL